MRSNRLAREKSPYLLQHASNPVDWRPWGPEAFEKARRENKPIFLSVGYSTCHWCHVMEHESFENETIARYLNEHFVPVKVDREERPDVDRIYMTYVQAATGSGGWPMSVWLTPDLKPFVGGTYFPPENRYGRPGFLTVLERIAEAWRDEHGRISEASARVVADLERQSALDPGASSASASVLDSGFFAFRRTFDSQLGGFGHAPKFPRPSVFHFLLRYWKRTGNEEALTMIATTLVAMARGGMNDQLGGGFHRYSVDAYWFVPHFEKMLYDQAQLVSVYIDLWTITKRDVFAREARRVLDYVLHGMTSGDGAFFSAEDADSAIDAAHPDKKGEGAFYIWTAQEIDSVCGSDARLVRYRYGVEDGGNVHDDPHGEFTGRNILFEAHSIDETAHHFEIPESEARAGFARACPQLLGARSQRPRPYLDDKVLTAWNGLMISAFAQAGAAFGEPAYLEAARRAKEFIVDRMWDPATRTLKRRWRDGETAVDGFLDDYAFFAQALLHLYEAELNEADLQLAVTIAEEMRVRFEDNERGGFFASAAAPDLVLRMKDDYDSAEPSGNAIAAMTLLRLERITQRNRLGDSARRTLQAFAPRLEEQPAAAPMLLAVLDLSLSPAAQIAIAGDVSTGEGLQMLRETHRRFLPDTVVLRAGAEMPALDGAATAYICQDFVCLPPVRTAVELAALLE